MLVQKSVDVLNDYFLLFSHFVSLVLPCPWAPDARIILPRVERDNSMVVLVTVFSERGGQQQGCYALFAGGFCVLSGL